MEIKILLVEDELITARRMQIALERKGYKITAIATSGDEALRAVQSVLPDIVLMDIHLSGKTDGITTAKSIRRMHSMPIIFVTEVNDAETFQNAKEAIPQNYITKPFDDETLYRAIELAIQNSLQPRGDIQQMGPRLTDGIFIKTKEQLYKKLCFSDIMYVKSEGAYSKIFFVDKNKQGESNFLISISSNNVIKQLAYPLLVKVHKSYYVNIHRIESIQGCELSIQGNKIPIGKGYKGLLENNLVFLKQAGK